MEKELKAILLKSLEGIVAAIESEGATESKKTIEQLRLIDSHINLYHIHGRDVVNEAKRFADHINSGKMSAAPTQLLNHDVSINLGWLYNLVEDCVDKMGVCDVSTEVVMEILDKKYGVGKNPLIFGEGDKDL